MSPHKNSNNKSSVNTGLAAVPEMGITSVYWHCTSLCNEGLSLCPSLWHFACLSFHWQNVLCPQPALGCTVSIGYLFTSQTTLRVKKLLFISKLNLFYSNLSLIFLLCTSMRNLPPSSMEDALPVFTRGCCQVSLKPCILQAEKVHLPQPLLTRQVFQP